MTTLQGLQRLIGCLLLVLTVTSCTSADKGEESSIASELAAEELALQEEGADDGIASEEDLSLQSGAGTDSASPEIAANEFDDASLSADLASEELTDFSLENDINAAAASTPQQASPSAPPAANQMAASPEPPLEIESFMPESSEPVFDTPPPQTNFAQAPAANGPAFGNEVTITDLRYVSRSGGGTVVIETSEPATYHTREVPSQNQLVIEVANAKLPDHFKRPYITKDFGQSIASINAYQDRGSSTVRVVVQFNSAMSADVRQEGRKLTLVSSGAASTETASASTEDGESFDSPVTSSQAKDPRILPAAAIDPAGYDGIKFYGRPISIEVRETAVRDVINLIAEQSGANIVLASDVEGNISLKLRQIPWDQALLIVMKSRGLGYVRQGSILRIAPYESLQKEHEAAKKVVDAQKAAEPLRVKVIPVGYAKVEGLEKQITPFLTPGRGRAVADIRTNALVVTDTPDVLDRIANLVRALDTPPLQVLIEGKVIEARENFSRDIGVSWGFGGDTDVGGKSFSNNINIGRDTISGLPPFDFSFGVLDGIGTIDLKLGLMEREDLVKIVSSPRVVAMNNEQASIVQSTQIPVPTTTVVNGTPMTTFSYTPIEMRLEVTPQVTSESDIILQLDIKREFAGNRLRDTTPDINKREAKTKLLVRNGQTAVVGGVYQSDMNEVEQGIPWVRNVPLLGWLFKSKGVRSDKNELLVFLTPRILNAEKAIQKESVL